jgi:hypothetical protein
VERVIGADRDEWVPVFTGLSVRKFRRLVWIVAGRGGEQAGTGRRWSLPLADRVLLIAVYHRTNLTLRQVALLFGVSKSAAHRVVDHLAPLLALASVTRRHSPDTVLIVDGTLVPVHDRTVTASSKNYRYSVNMQVVIDANTRLVVAVGRPVPGNPNDCTAFRDSGTEAACRGDLCAPRRQAWRRHEDQEVTTRSEYSSTRRICPHGPQGATGSGAARHGSGVARERSPVLP